MKTLRDKIQEIIGDIEDYPTGSSATDAILSAVRDSLPKKTESFSEWQDGYNNAIKEMEEKLGW